MGSTALGFWRAALNDGVVKCFSSSSRIRRCIPKGTARPASQRFNVEYVTQRNRANSSCEVFIVFLIFRTWLGVILGIPTPSRTSISIEFGRMAFVKRLQQPIEQKHGILCSWI